MTKQAINTGRAGVAPSLEVIRCAGCGAALPVGGPVEPWLELRCDLCWRSTLAAEAAHWREEQNAALAPWYDAVVRRALRPS